MTELYNLQRKVEVDISSLQQFADQLGRSVEETAGRGFAGALVTDERMRELNQFFRGKDSATDVLSFPHEPTEFDPREDFLGDIVISAETAQQQAIENGLALETEIKQLVLHGLLHLCGYDHEADKGEMDSREMELRRRLGIE
jgi:probable rRNA maturation factor